MAPRQEWGNQVVHVAALLDTRLTSVSSLHGDKAGCAIPPRLYKLVRFFMGIAGLAAALGVGRVVYKSLAPYPDDVVFDPALDKIQMPIDKVSELWKPGEFQCLGWRAVDGCDPNGVRTPKRDRGCNYPIKRGMAGYCEVRNRTSGEVFRVMASTCRAIDDHHEYTCNMATNFTDFSIMAARYHHKETLKVSPLSQPAKRGIVMCIFDRVLASAYAVIVTLRNMKCTLPIELFYHAEEIDLSNPVLAELIGKYNAVLRPIANKAAKKYKAKPYAMYHSSFDEVLFLDSDNIPSRDPTYLFDSPEFLNTGAVFWPDFWQANYSIFNVNPQSLLWQLMDIPPFGVFEQESGQLLVDRRRSQAALDKLMFYTMHGQMLEQLNLVWGDKDLFRFAWHNTSTPYHFIERPPALGGLYDAKYDRFCGVAMLQFDPEGELIFIHRNSYKMSGRQEQVPLVTHMQAFDFGSVPTNQYVVHHTGPGVGLGGCWALEDNVPNRIIPLSSTHAAKVEVHALHHAMEAGITMGIQPEIVRLDLPQAAWWETTLEWIVWSVLWGSLVGVLLCAFHWVAIRSVFGDKKLHWIDRYAGKKRKLSEYPIV